MSLIEHVDERLAWRVRTPSVKKKPFLCVLRALVVNTPFVFWTRVF